MDNGEVIQDIDQPWSFMQVRLMEWICGAVFALIVQLFFKSPANAIPFMLVGVFAVAFSMAGVRKLYPDEERGLRNAFAVFLGIPPVGIPTPSKMQPIWSGGQIRDLKEDTNFKKLRLDYIFPYHVRDLIVEDDQVSVVSKKV